MVISIPLLFIAYITSLIFSRRVVVQQAPDHGSKYGTRRIFGYSRAVGRKGGIYYAAVPRILSDALT
jgi:hypothetical protein